MEGVYEKPETKRARTHNIELSVSNSQELQTTRDTVAAKRKRVPAVAANANEEDDDGRVAPVNPVKSEHQESTECAEASRDDEFVKDLKSIFVHLPDAVEAAERIVDVFANDDPDKRSLTVKRGLTNPYVCIPQIRSVDELGEYFERGDDFVDKNVRRWICACLMESTANDEWLPNVALYESNIIIAMMSRNKQNKQNKQSNR